MTNRAPGLTGPSEPPKLFIIILNWNGRDNLLDCLASLSQLTYSNFQIVVVDNGSSDGSGEAVRERFPAVELIENEKNLGFAEGNNIGIRNAIDRGADYVLLLNNDTIFFEKDWIESLLEYAQQNHRCLIGPLILYWPSNTIWFAGGRISWITGFCSHWGKGKPWQQWEKTQPHQVDYISGCALLLHKEIIKAVGFFDPLYFLYYEDVDFCTRAKKLGFACYVVPQSRMGHKISASAGNPGSDRLSALQAYYFGRNGIRFARKNLYGIKKIFFLFGQLSFRLIYGLVHCRNRKSKKAYIQGIVDGFRDRVVRENHLTSRA